MPDNNKLPPTVDELFKNVPDSPPQGSQNSNLPTVDELFKDVPDDPKTPTGPFSDWWFSHSQAGKVLSAYGQGFEQGWGKDPIGMSKETNEWLTKKGILPDYTKGNDNLFKSLNGAFLRPLFKTVDLAQRIPNALLQSVASGLEQSGKSLQEMETPHNLGGGFGVSTVGGVPTDLSIPNLGSAFGGGNIGLSTLIGAPGELASGVQSGFGGGDVGHLPADVNMARAEGIIGESAHGRAAAATAEQLAERNRAVGNLPDNYLNPKDIHEAAANIAPDVYQSYQTLA
jgi:hypothetical protein